MTVRIGTSGWQYRHWIGRYYPDGLPQARWLERYAADFDTVELNVSFYHLPRASVFAGWAARTPADFRFAVKASRYLTHVRRLRDPKEPVERLLQAAAPLGPKLGPVLLQLPPDLPADPESLAATLDCFPRSVRVAVEFRHDSWLSPEVEAVLAEHRAAFCLTDRDGRRSAATRTAEWTYLRLHSGCAEPRPCYDEASIRAWGESIVAGWSREAEAWVFFNNDPAGCAVRDAALAGPIFAALGVQSGRVPDVRGIRAG